MDTPHEEACMDFTRGAAVGLELPLRAGVSCSSELRSRTPSYSTFLDGLTADRLVIVEMHTV